MESCERHAVDVAGGRGLRSIHVAVSIDPEQSNFLVLPAVELGDPGHGAGSDGVIAAEDERNGAGLETFEDQFGAFGAGCGDFLQIFGMGGAFLLLLGDGDGDVSAVLDDVADGSEGGFESGDADSGRAHVASPPRLAEIERDSDDANLLGSDGTEGCVGCWGHVKISKFQGFKVSKFQSYRVSKFLGYEVS